MTDDLPDPMLSRPSWEQMQSLREIERGILLCTVVKIRNALEYLERARNDPPELLRRLDTLLTVERDLAAELERQNAALGLPANEGRGR